MKQKNRIGMAVKAVAVVAVVAGVATAGFDIKETKAVASAPTGSCGLLVSRNLSGYNTYMNGGSGIGSASNGVVNFDAGSVSGKMTLINNYGLSNAVDTEADITGSVTATATTIPNTYLVTFTLSAGSSTYVPQYYFTATNGGNTYLVRTKPIADNNTGAWTGVCQAL